MEGLLTKSDLSIVSSISEDHIPIMKKKPVANAMAQNKTTANREFLAAKMRLGLKRLQDKGFVDSVFSLITVPLTFVRDYTCPMSEPEQWDKRRAAILPLTIPTGMLVLTGSLNFTSEDEEVIKATEQNCFILLCLLVPGLLASIYIMMRTKKTQAPDSLLNFYSAVAFLTSLVWISFTADCIMDMLRLFGFISSLPTAMLALTVLAWGNSLGDLTADLAMTKKGFGEMAITGAMAGPVFNILVG